MQKKKEELKEYSYKVHVYNCPSSGPLKKDETVNLSSLVEIAKGDILLTKEFSDIDV